MSGDHNMNQNDFNPNWDAMAVMVEEQQRMAKRIEELEQAPKREWVGLTDEEIEKLIRTMMSKDQAFAGFVRFIEAKLKEKNNG